MTKRIIAAAVLIASGLVSGCAGQAPPVALLTYDRPGCAAGPVLEHALSLTPDKERVSHIVSTTIDAGSACVATAEGATPYAVYALPADTDDKTLTVGGVLELTRIFSPNVALLDTQGRVLRTFAAEDYMYRGAVYSVQFRPRPGEAYVLVTANPQRVGQQYNSIAIGTSTVSTYSPAGAVSWTYGTDASQSRTFSYEGTVQVIVYDTDTEEGA